MSCEFCDFNQKEKDWNIELYESTSPADGKLS